MLDTLCVRLLVNLCKYIFSGCHALFFCLNYQEGKNALFRASQVGNLDAVIRELTGHTDVNFQDKVCFATLPEIA